MTIALMLSAFALFCTVPHVVHHREVVRACEADGGEWKRRECHSGTAVVE